MTRNELEWVPLLSGRLAAAAAPSRERLAGWAAAGATAVLTLQRADEMQPWLPGACGEAGLSWWHLPLTGRRMEHPQDRESLAFLPSLLGRWGEPVSAVVHCAAGLHRTGVVSYLLFRLSGLGPEGSLERLRATRAQSASELEARVRSGVLRERAEKILEGLGR